jgi:GrpB-like predicted nucleotidyltransferase (UPF0157 family)
MDYDSTWPATFVTLQAPIWEALRGVALSVEHIGSTSVPRLAAKPIIDIDVVVPSRTKMSVIIERLAKLRYVHRGNLGIENREAFDSPTGLPAHHLYACLQGTAALANHLAVRDYLRRDPAAAAAYGKLKKQLAAQFPTDVESYVAGKTDFLIEILGRAGLIDATPQIGPGALQ